eukprot:1196084-Prorocentrum_minimum.AAC.2
MPVSGPTHNKHGSAPKLKHTHRSTAPYYYLLLALALGRCVVAVLRHEVAIVGAAVFEVLVHAAGDGRHVFRHVSREVPARCQQLVHGGGVALGAAVGVEGPRTGDRSPRTVGLGLDVVVVATRVLGRARQRGAEVGEVLLRLHVLEEVGVVPYWVEQAVVVLGLELVIFLHEEDVALVGPLGALRAPGAPTVAAVI